MGAGLVHKKDRYKFPKTEKQMEKHIKGVANHHRIKILMLIKEEEGITVDGITTVLRGNFKTISEHTRRLVYAGLIEKKYRGRNIAHSLTPYGEIFVTFLKTFQYS